MDDKNTAISHQHYLRLTTSTIISTIIGNMLQQVSAVMPII
ncbi:hypothetical protein J2Y02_001114 [Neobacillus drentensis]|nr:hypothetical protein [Neobacillus drentensis]